MAQRVAAVRPSFHVFGHIHESRGAMGNRGIRPSVHAFIHLFRLKASLKCSAGPWPLTPPSHPTLASVDWGGIFPGRREHVPWKAHTLARSAAVANAANSRSVTA